MIEFSEVMSMSEPQFQRLFRLCLRRLWKGSVTYAKGNYLAKMRPGEVRTFPNRSKVHNVDRIRARAFLKDPEAQWKSKVHDDDSLTITRVR